MGPWTASPGKRALSAIKPMAALLRTLKLTGTVAEVLDPYPSFQEFTALGGLSELQQVEHRFSVRG